MATAVNTTVTGHPEKPKHGSKKMTSMFTGTSREKRLQAGAESVSSNFEKYLEEREHVIRDINKWGLQQNSELRALIGACTDNVIQANDVMRYYDSTFARLFATLEKVDRDRKNVETLKKKLDDTEKEITRLADKERKSAEKKGPEATKTRDYHERRTAEAMKEVELAKETNKQVLVNYRRTHMRLRRALFNLTAARIEQHRKLVGIDLQFLESLRRFKYPSAIQDDGVVIYSEFEKDLPENEEIAGWYDGGWTAPEWLGSKIIAAIDESDGAATSPGSSVGGSPAPIIDESRQMGGPLEKGLYPGNVGLDSLATGKVYKDPADTYNAKRWHKDMERNVERHVDDKMSSVSSTSGHANKRDHAFGTTSRVAVVDSHEKHGQKHFDTASSVSQKSSSTHGQPRVDTVTNPGRNHPLDLNYEAQQGAVHDKDNGTGRKHLVDSDRKTFKVETRTEDTYQVGLKQVNNPGRNHPTEVQM